MTQRTLELIEKTSYSQQRTLLRCPKKYEYHYVKKIRPKKDDDKFLFGRAVHQFLETYYEAQKESKYSKDEAFKIAHQAFQTYVQHHFPDNDEAHEQANLAEAVIKHYHQWARENDNFLILGVEVPFELVIGKTKFIGYFDAIIEISGKYWIMEHKTANQTKTEHTIRDKQISVYVWAARELGIPVEGVIYNTIKKAVPEKPKVLKSGKLSQALNQNVTFNSYMEAIKELGHDPSGYQEILSKLEEKENTFFSREFVTRTDEAVEAAKRDIHQTEALKSALVELNIFPRNDTRDCAWDCPFNDLCLAELEGRDTNALLLEKYKIAE
ncbi:hypothetical protein DCC39_10400 [Pueribacillus theae]|uniref:PD-(D/E)XK endonuclease-like domain-containing protein n=1 Tax=Pueribacillus theae TaxID=2171751 RepID=A0A2U1K0R2_9BACI|nr:PD-(D/E)XK nuclease family protein [Pueribacillus theae]PWA11100.1 hypothetical protein DCC39_10400 [Pueribacillus theae]